jgi:hypothetical protein
MPVKKQTFTVVSIDVGLRTCSMCKEQYTPHKITSITPPETTYGEYGTATDEWLDYIKKVVKCGSLIGLEKRDLGTKQDFFAGRAYFNLIDWLDELANNEYFDGVDVILIEQQMKTNNIALALMYHIQSWCMIQFRQFKKIILYPSKQKTRVLGAPLKQEDDEGKLKKTTKYQRKKWSVDTVKEFLELRKDEKNLEYIFKENKSKKDDLCDTVVQGLSYIVTTFCPVSTKKVKKSSKSKK